MVLAYLEEEVLEDRGHSKEAFQRKGQEDLEFSPDSSWPGLSTLAVRFLGCPPSTVPSEKLFSTPMDAGSFGQPRLMMEHFEKLIFLKVNLPLICFQY